jgi:hypothetical protein
MKAMASGDHPDDEANEGGVNGSLVKKLVEIHHQEEDKKYMQILVRELVHWKNVGVGVAARGMKMFDTKTLILEYEQKKCVVVMTVFDLPQCRMYQVFDDQTSWGNLLLVPIQQQRNFLWSLYHQ